MNIDEESKKIAALLYDTLKYLDAKDRNILKNYNTNGKTEDGKDYFHLDAVAVQEILDIFKHRFMNEIWKEMDKVGGFLANSNNDYNKGWNECSNKVYQTLRDFESKMYKGENNNVDS